MKALKKLAKALKKRGSKAAKSLKSKIPSVSLGRKAKAGLAVAALLVAAGGGYEVSQSIKAQSFKDGCVDGAAIGMTSLLGMIVGDHFIVNKEGLFGKACGKLSQAYAGGKRIGEGKAEQQQQQGQPQGGQEDDQSEE